MPRRPPRPCSIPGCPMLVVAGSRCSEHKLDAERARGSSYQRGYGSSTGWPKIRARYLRTHPMCEQDGCTKPAKDVNHIDGAGPYGDNSDANLEALCHPHHSQHTAQHQPGGWNRR